MSFKLTQDFKTQLESDGLTLYANDSPVSVGQTIYDGMILEVRSGGQKIVYFGGGFDPATGMPLDEWDIAPDKLSASWTVDSYVTIENFGYEVEPPSEPSKPFTLTESFLTQLSNDGIEVTVNDVPYNDGADFGDNVKLISSERYFVKVGGGYDSATGMPFDDWIFNDNKTQAFWTVSQDNSGNSQYSNSIDYVLGDPISKEPITVNTINDVYSLSDEQTRELIKRRFLVQKGDEWVDYGVYILGLIKLPFDVSDYKIGDTKIKLGDLVTDIDGDIVDTDYIEFDLGSISVTGDNGNLLDYANTISVLHLPFIKSISIDLKYVIGETLNIKYGVNLYTGFCDIKITSTKNNSVIYTDIVDLNINIPFTNVNDRTPTSPYNIELAIDNGIKTPYLELIKNDSVLPYGFFTIPVIDESVLNDVTGYIEVDNINLKTSANSNEYNELVATLRNGVIL